MIFSPTNCPRCNARWQYSPSPKIFPKCSCGMRVIQEANPQEYIGVVGITLGKYSVEWECCHDDYCFFTTDDCDEYVEMPWLPLDITEEQLILFITFL